MKIGATHSHKNGDALIRHHHPKIIADIEAAIHSIDAEACRLKSPKGKEKERAARIGVERFYSPIHINAVFDWYFLNHEWDLKPRIKTGDLARRGYRELDAVKERVGVEIQIGKYAFLTYDIVVKMVIFRNRGLIDFGIEICPMASILPHMSSGIGAFEQVRWDLVNRTVADIDIPVLVIGIESELVSSQSRNYLDSELEVLADEASIVNEVDIKSQTGIITGRYGRKELTNAALKCLNEVGINTDTGLK